MKRAALKLLWCAILLCMTVLAQGGRAFMQAEEINLTITPAKAFFLPGETAVFAIEASGGTRVEAVITHLAETVDTIQRRPDRR